MDGLPVGTRLTKIRWYVEPDKYAGPQLFDSLERARKHANGIITAVLDVTTPDGRTMTIGGGVSSVDSIWRDSPRQDPGVLPEPNATLVELVSVADEIIFANPDGGRFVLIGPGPFDV